MKLLYKILLPTSLCALALGLLPPPSAVTGGLKALLPPALRQTPPAPKFIQGEELTPWLKNHARRMNRMDTNPASSERDLAEAAAALSAEQMLALGAAVLDQSAPLNERLVALHLLRLNKNSSSESFERIALLEEKVADGHHAQYVETALAFSALEEIELRSLSDRREIERLLRIGRASRNPKLNHVFPQILAAAKNQQPFYLEAQK